MATTKKVFEWKKFTGLSDSSVIGASGQYDNSSYNIDTQTEPNGVKLTPQPQLLYSTTDTPRFILNANDYGELGIFSFCDDGSIYRDGTSVFTLSSGKSIRGAVGQYGDNGELYIIFFTRNYIHRLKYSDNSVDEDWISINDKDYNKNPLNIYGNIYFGSGNVFYKLDNIGTLSTIYTFPKQDNIAGITFFQDNFNIYTTGGNYGRQYVFPILSETPYYNIEWKGLPILGALNEGGLDYVVTGYNSSYSDLYLVSGTQKKALKINSEGSGSRKFNGILHNRLGDMYIAGSYNGDKKLFRFGNYYNGFSQELIPYLDFTNDVTCINSSSTALYVGTEDNKVYIINLNSIPDYYQSEGGITSLVSDFGTPDTKKYLNELHLAYDNRGTNMSDRGGSFVLYARKFETDGWTELYSTDNLYNTGNIKMYQTELADKGFNDFYQLQFKVKLISRNNGDGFLYTPFFKKLKVIYTDDIN